MTNSLVLDDKSELTNGAGKSTLTNTTVADTGTAKTKVANTKVITEASAVKATTPPWMVVARTSDTEPWYAATLRWRGRTKHKVEFNHNKEVRWLDKSNVLLWVHHYRPTETKKTRVDVRGFLSPNDTKVYSILVHSFPASGTSVPFNVPDKIAALLMSNLPMIKSGTTMTISFHGSVDDVGYLQNNLKLVNRRKKAVAQVWPIVFYKWIQPILSQEPFTKINVIVDNNQKLQSNAADFLFKKDPVHRSDPKIRPQLRSVLMTLRLTGNSHFSKPTQIPKKVLDSIRLHLMTIENKTGSLVERRRAHIAAVLLRVKRGDLKERFLNKQEVINYDHAYNIGFTVNRWMLVLGGGASAWDSVLSEALTGVPSLPTLEKALDRILKRMYEAYAYARRGQANQESYGSQSAVKSFMSVVSSENIMRARLIR